MTPWCRQSGTDVTTRVARRHPGVPGWAGTRPQIQAGQALAPRAADGTGPHPVAQAMPLEIGFKRRLLATHCHHLRPLVRRGRNPSGISNPTVPVRAGESRLERGYDDRNGMRIPRCQGGTVLDCALLLLAATHRLPTSAARPPCRGPLTSRTAASPSAAGSSTTIARP